MAIGKIKMTTSKKSSRATSSKSKSKLVAGAVSIAIAAGGAGYAINEVVDPVDLLSPEPTYVVTNYKLRKAKRTLNSLVVRTNDEASTKFNSNGLVNLYWSDTNDSGCNTRYDMLFGSLSKAKKGNAKCAVQSGELFDYYTGKTVSDINKVHIDHVVSKKNAWDSGGSEWDADTWAEYVNDEKRVLLAVSAEANQSKGSKDAADWLPENTAYWCKYVIQQIEIKSYYDLSVRQAEKDRMSEILSNNCQTK